MIREDKGKIWGEFLLKLADVLYLICNLTQEAGCCQHEEELFLKRNSKFDQAHQLAPRGTPAARCVRERFSGRYTLCVNGKIIKPPDFKHPDAESLAQVVNVERSTSEGFLHH